MRDDMYGYLKPEARVTQSELTGHWVVDADDPVKAQGYRYHEDALAEAETRTAAELRRSAAAYERNARNRANDPDMLATA